MLNKLLGAFRKKTPTIDVVGYEKPNVCFRCDETLKMELQEFVARMPNGKTFEAVIVVFMFAEDKQAYWGELVNKSQLEDTLLRYFGPRPGAPEEDDDPESSR